MRKIQDRLQVFISDEAGSPAIEYAIIGSVIGVLLIVSLNEIGSGLVGLFEGFNGAF